MKNILSVEQFDKAELQDLFSQATYYSRHSRTLTVADGLILTNLFYEPSTRTSSSFFSAMVRLGGHVNQINDVRYSSVAKGESLEDTIRTMQCYSDVIVLRHPTEGAAVRAAEVASVPIINAGDGIGEHPTQALLDLYTILREIGTLNRLHVVMMGDLLRGRTVKSLAKLLRLYETKITWVSPANLRIPPAYIANGEVETDDLDAVIGDADVLYLTRSQRERASNDAVEIAYGISMEQMQRAKSTMILMHPLPRTAELPTEIDFDPRAAYFRQMRHGLFIRMAVLSTVLFDQ